ncbi:ATP-binding protein [Caulobacter sp. ErkDOM-E]|uniref:PAS domain-containing hybrid sensor histidine kinase/response regulator n=1 Tax=Caulobacter sp. ErkDOM-E TaxID=3402778 RepID=UPI003AF7E87B
MEIHPEKSSEMVPQLHAATGGLFARACDKAAIVVRTDLNGNIIECNDKFCEVSGYTRSEIIGAKHNIFSPDRYPPEFFPDMYEAIVAGGTWSGTVCCRRKSGSLYWLDTTITPQLDAAGEPVAYLAIRFDVTAHQQALADLAEAQQRCESAARAKGRFLATMSHELRTPLTGVIGLTELLAQTPLDLKQQDYVASLLEAARALHAIVNDVLSLAKAEANPVIRPAPVNPADFLAATIRLLSPIAAKKGVALSLRLAEGVPEVIVADADRLRQIVVNLVGNALKFTEVGEVSVEAAWLGPRDGGRLRIDVIDSGPGFPAELAERIFDPFEQVDNSATRLHDGAGLGLAISAHLIKAMNGEIAAENRPEGGARFWFEIPVETCRVKIAQLQPLVRVENEPLEVLIVEDNPMLQRLIKTILESAGHVCAVADNGAVALEMMRAQPFDVCLMDLRMPIMDGITATRIIHQEPPGGWGAPPIIALSADVLDGDMEHYSDLGFHAFLAKPIDASLLLRTIGGAAMATAV